MSYRRAVATDETPAKLSKSAGRPLGQTGETVRKNIRRIRDSKGISGPELSAKLDELERPIPPLGIHRIESGQRRVDVDDLAVLALALNVSPAALLMPSAGHVDDQVQVTGCPESHNAELVWDWLVAEKPLTRWGSLSEGDQWVEFVHESWPGWKVRELYERLYRQDAEQKRSRGVTDGDD
jgi:transcriptional regulator with XRE-family HTH domain